MSLGESVGIIEYAEGEEEGEGGVVEKDVSVALQSAIEGV